MLLHAGVAGRLTWVQAKDLPFVSFDDSVGDLLAAWVSGGAILSVPLLGEPCEFVEIVEKRVLVRIRSRSSGLLGCLGEISGVSGSWSLTNAFS